MKILLLTSYLPERVKNAVRFMIVGTLGSFVQTWFFLLAMRILGEPAKDTTLYYVAFIIGFVLEMIPNYICTNWYTFETRPNIKNAEGFVLARAINLVIQMVLLPLAVRFFTHVDNSILSLVVIFLAGIINFLVQLCFFKKK